MADNRNCHHERSLAFTAVSGSPSLEESCTSIYAYLELLGIPSLLRKDSLLDGVLYCKFFVDIK